MIIKSLYVNKSCLKLLDSYDRLFVDYRASLRLITH